MTESTKKRESQAVTTRQLDDGRIEFTILRAGPGGAPRVLVFDPTRASEANRRYAQFYGWKIRMERAAAVSADAKTGKVNPVEKGDEIARVIAHYESGATGWDCPRQGGRVAGAQLDALALAAVAEALGMSVAEARERVVRGAEKAGITQGAYLATAAASKLAAPILARLRAEQAAGVGVSGDELLAEMQGVEEAGGGEG